MSGEEGAFETALTGDAARAPESVAGGRELAGLVDAAFSRDPEDLVAARRAVIAELGAPSLVDAAAVFGNFQRMVRIADGTGIPLDQQMLAMSADLRGPLGIEEFGSAANSRT